MMRRLVISLLLALVCTVAIPPADASSLTRPQILQALSDLETCVRTMCLPANNATMGIGYAEELARKLNQTPNALDQWVLGRLNPIIALLKEKKIKPALDKTQATIAALIRPQVLKNLKDLEVCIRTMCLPGGEASMGIGYVEQQVKELAKYPGAFSAWVTQRLNAGALLLKQKKIAEGLAHVQATIRDLPAA